MAKGGKGRKGGGGGGGKTRKYSRDNKGRFASTGSGGATARGGRLKTASGNKRKTQTITATGQKGVLAKPKGLKPESTNRLKTGIFISKRRAVNAQLANKPDQAVVNIPGRFTGRAGKSFDASITRAVATVKASKDAKFKTKAEVKADQAKTKAAKEAKPKRVRSAESLRVSRAKQVEKRRSITTNPAGVRASAAAKMAANATRTQQRAAAFYKAGGKPAAKPATATPKAKSPKFTTEQSGRVRRAALGGGRTAIVRKNSAVIINAKGEPIMTRKGLPNITAGKKYAANPNARGPRLMGRDRSEASPSRGYIRTSKPTGTIGKPKGLKPGSIKPKAAAAAKPVAPKATKPKGKAKIDDSKVSRVISRVNDVVRGSEQKTGVKRLNAIQVGVRAKSFLARKEGGNVGILSQKSQPEAFSSVRKAMTKPPRYSTQKPSRNKPGRFNDLGQDKLRAKARTDAMTGRERIAKANESAVAKAKERKGKIPTRTISRRSLPQLGAPRAPGYVKGPRQTGTMAKPKIASTPVSSTVARTRTQAKAAQRNRREQILDRARTGFSGISKMKKNPRIKRSDTGMRQLSLVGKAKTLYRFKHIKPRPMR